MNENHFKSWLEIKSKRWPFFLICGLYAFFFCFGERKNVSFDLFRHFRLHLNWWVGWESVLQSDVRGKKEETSFLSWARSLENTMGLRCVKYRLVIGFGLAVFFLINADTSMLPIKIVHWSVCRIGPPKKKMTMATILIKYTTIW